jgi:hypothetical protein
MVGPVFVGKSLEGIAILHMVSNITEDIWLHVQRMSPIFYGDSEPKV